MTSIIAQRSPLRRGLDALAKFLVPTSAHLAPPDDPQETDLATREYLLEMIDRNPEAFQTEFDIQHMARLYRSRH